MVATAGLTAFAHIACSHSSLLQHFVIPTRAMAGLREEIEVVEAHIENEIGRVEIMEKLLAMLLVAFDSRRNPAARLLSQQAVVSVPFADAA